MMGVYGKFTKQLSSVYPLVAELRGSEGAVRSGVVSYL